MHADRIHCAHRAGNEQQRCLHRNERVPAAQRGADWANQVVEAVHQHTGITVVGADDIEAGFASTEAQAEDWETAFLADGKLKLIYNGSVDACPDTYGSRADCALVLDDNGGTKNWTRAQYVRLTYSLGVGRISVLPQIYSNNNSSNAVQWLNIDVSSGYKLTFEGTLTQYSICNSIKCGFTGSRGWAALYHALSIVTAFPRVPVATDLQPN